MEGRTLIYASINKNYISLRTVSRTRKSSHKFYIPSCRMRELEYKPEAIAHDIYSFAVLRRDARSENIGIEFTWLGDDGGSLAGYTEAVNINYKSLMECLQESTASGKDVKWKALSKDSRRKPKIIFKSRENLHNVLENTAIRKKLSRSLRGQFNWPNLDRVELYDDFVPFSFTFCGIQDGEPAIVGGLILHGQEDMENAYYSLHT